MRSFIAFMVCTGFIVWAHSCEKRIVGVKISGHGPYEPHSPQGFSLHVSPIPVPVLIANADSRNHTDTISVMLQDLLSVKQGWNR